MPSLTIIDSNTLELKTYRMNLKAYSVTDILYTLSARQYEDLPAVIAGNVIFNQNNPKILGFDSIKGDALYSAPLENIVSNYKSLKSNVTNFKNSQTPLPIAVRCVTEFGRYFIERFPFQKTVDLSNHLRKQSISKEDNITIWIPWTMAVVSPKSPNEFRLLYSHQSLTSEDDIYIGGLFPNSYSRGHICFGQSSYQYPELFSQDGKNNVDVRHAYSTLFNEYFDAGWNTDLSPHIYSNLTYYISDIKSKKSIYPSLYNFLFPDQDLIKKKLSHVSKSKLKILTSPFTRSHTPLQQHTYTLLMLATLSLEETLEFYKEYSDFLVNHNFEHAIKFKNMDFESENDTIGRTLPMNYLLNPPIQANQNLESNLQFEDIELRKAYVLYYDSSRSNTPPYSQEFNFLYSKEIYVGKNFENYNNLFKDYMKNSNVEADKNLCDLYFVDVKDFSWEKFTIDKTQVPGFKTNHKNLALNEETILLAFHTFKIYIEKFSTSVTV